MSIYVGLSNFNENNHLDLNNKEVKNSFINILKKDLFKVIDFNDNNNIKLTTRDNNIVFDIIIKLLNNNFTINQKNKFVINEYYILGLLEIYNFLLINKEQEIIININ